MKKHKCLECSMYLIINGEPYCNFAGEPIKEKVWSFCGGYKKKRKRK